jgi:hypothetical protein
MKGSLQLTAQAGRRSFLHPPSPSPEIDIQLKFQRTRVIVPPADRNPAAKKTESALDPAHVQDVVDAMYGVVNGRRRRTRDDTGRGALR